MVADVNQIKLKTNSMYLKWCR